jgi:hypothetical protein
METLVVTSGGLGLLLVPLREEWKQIRQTYKVQSLKKEELTVAETEVSGFLARTVGVLTEDPVLARKKKVEDFIEKIYTFLFLIQDKKYNSKFQKPTLELIDQAITDFEQRYNSLKRNLNSESSVTCSGAIQTEAEFLAEICMKRFFRAQSLRLEREAEIFLNLSNDFTELSRTIA